METHDSAPAFAAATASQQHAAPTVRLVIRAKILSDAPAPPTNEHVPRRAIALVLAVAALIALAWIGVSVFGTDAPSAPPSSNSASTPPPVSTIAPARNDVPLEAKEAPHPRTAPAPAAQSAAVSPTSSPHKDQAKPKTSDTPQQSAMPLSTIKQVVPDVPQSARQTIRGTIRVSIRVNVQSDGTVRAASTHIAGPSRYFERLALGAAKKWTFAPATAPEERTALLGFYFTRDGARAELSPTS